MDTCDVMLKLQQAIKIFVNTRYLHLDNGLYRAVKRSPVRGSSYTAKDINYVMKELDANLLAYFVSDNSMSMKPDGEVIVNATQSSEIDTNLTKNVANETYKQQQLDIFRNVTSVKIQMEALTLQAEGTQRMDLLQTDIRPIFTIECQLSHELIKSVERSDLFHIMQFESEKFQTQTQCTRFGMEDQRAICIAANELNANATEDEFENKAIDMNLGRIHFCVWWRESGTCLNEVLGMGVLELKELYTASLLEQCKCIAIVRRGIHLANVYFKISLLQGITSSNNLAMEKMNDITLSPYADTGFNTHVQEGEEDDTVYKKDNHTIESEANQITRNSLLDVYRTGEYFTDCFPYLQHQNAQ